MFAGEAAHAFAFVAHHPGHGGGDIVVEQVGFAAHVGAHYPDVVLFELAQGAGEVGYGDVGHGFGGAAGHFAHGGVQADAAVFRRNHGVYAHGVGHAQAGAEVVWVGDAVEDEQQGRLGEVVEHVVEVDVVVRSVDKAGDALVSGVAAQIIKAGGFHEVNGNIFLRGFFQGLLHTGIVTAGQGVELGEAFGVLPQAGVDGVEAVNQAAVGHMVCFRDAGYLKKRMRFQVAF